ncbi:hypothetical protein AMTRI_Chr10g229820 [Amborella trichopoda]
MVSESSTNIQPWLLSMSFSKLNKPFPLEKAQLLFDNFTPSLSMLPKIHQWLPILSLCWPFHCERSVFNSGALSVLFPVMWLKVSSLGEECLPTICSSKGFFKLLKAVFLLPKKQKKGVFLFFNSDCLAKNSE